jgi:UDP-N-acetylglucosamine 4,6-dehydratase/5-epimerase
MRSFCDSTTPGIDLNGSVLLVTGGTGSFGKEFSRTVLERYGLKKLIVFSRDELKQYEMQIDPVFRPHLDKMRFLIGDVRDAGRLELAFRGVDYVVHAAALKQVPAAEYNPFECIKTNVNGAENVVNAAIRTDVRMVVALSTDKAANPVNLYGASKLASDKIFIAGQRVAAEYGPKFAVVRYGNVINSRGSVVPLFQQMVKNNEKWLPITDKRMTRFLITLQQGVAFVLSSFGLIREGGEMFVPKIPSARITDLAEFIAPGLEQREIGIRPGEKLHEMMITEDDARQTVELADRYVIKPVFWRPEEEIEHATPVADRFSYSSDANDEWVNRDLLEEMIFPGSNPFC